MWCERGGYSGRVITPPVCRSLTVVVIAGAAEEERRTPGRNLAASAPTTRAEKILKKTKENKGEEKRWRRMVGGPEKPEME